MNEKEQIRQKISSTPLEKSCSSEKDGKREDGIIVEEEDENEDENLKLLKNINDYFLSI